MKPIIVTTSMGRLSFLKQTLPTWLELTPFSILVIDYSCPDQTASWAWDLGLGNDRVRAIPVIAPDGRWDKPRAMNAAVRDLVCLLGLTRYKEARVLLLDADTVLCRQLTAEDLGTADEFRIVDPKHATRDLTGVLSAPLPALIAAGMFNEELIGYGAEDLDMRLRLYLRTGLKVTTFEPDTFRAIPHPDELRTRFTAEKSLDASGRANVIRMFQSLTPSELARTKAPEEAETMRLLLAPELRPSAPE